jgi:hypothetical protein
VEYVYKLAMEKDIKPYTDNKNDSHAKNGELLLESIRNKYYQLGKTEEDFNNSMASVGESINMQTINNLLQSKPPNRKLKIEEVNAYIEKYFSEDEVLEARNSANNEVITKWLAALTRQQTEGE